LELARAGASSRFGHVALVGRPNAGKSTLLNRLLGEKVSIVSDKPQTTRRALLGVLTAPQGQIVFYDTPGLHRPLHRMNRQMMSAATDSLRDADLVCLVVDASEPFGRGDEFARRLVADAEPPKLLVLNKIDRIEKPALLPLMERYGRDGVFAEILPLSARTGDGCDRLLDALWRMLPEGEPRHEPDLLTPHTERFLAAERIREKVLEHTREELPHATAVEIERWEEEGNLTRIYASILVEKPGQKKIVIGARGASIKAIGTAARLDLERFLGRRVYLDLHVREVADWREDEAVLARLGRDA
jgi:GTP-binding protein Era